jgi:hypothetical protein
VASNRRRTFLLRAGILSLPPAWRNGWTATRPGAAFRRNRPADAARPSAAAWETLNRAVDGHLDKLDAPLDVCRAALDGFFFVHHGVGSEDWSADGFTRVKA